MYIHEYISKFERQMTAIIRRYFYDYCAKSVSGMIVILDDFDTEHHVLYVTV